MDLRFVGSLYCVNNMHARKIDKYKLALTSTTSSLMRFTHAYQMDLDLLPVLDNHNTSSGCPGGDLEIEFILGNRS